MAVVCNAAKRDGVDFVTGGAAGTDVCKLAFYGAAASVSGASATYTATGEVTDTGAGTPIPVGGVTLASRSLSTDLAATAWADWANVTVTPTQTIQFQKILIYNSTRNRALWFHDYGSVQTWNAGTAYTLTIPDSGDNTGVVRIA